jgi:hypothetical protein
LLGHYQLIAPTFLLSYLTSASNCLRFDPSSWIAPLGPIRYRSWLRRNFRGPNKARFT